MAVFAPMPSASVSTATAVKPGFFSNWRMANLRSFISIRFGLRWRRQSQGLFCLSNQPCEELCSVRSHSVACKDGVRAPRKQFVADHLRHRARLLRIAPAAVQDILVLEPEVACKDNAFAAQFRRIDG